MTCFMLLAQAETHRHSPQRWTERESNAAEEKRAQEARRQQEENDTQLLLAQFPPTISPEQQHTAFNAFLHGMHDAVTKPVRPCCLHTPKLILCSAAGVLCLWSPVHTRQDQVAHRHGFHKPERLQVCSLSCAPLLFSALTNLFRVPEALSIRHD